MLDFKKLGILIILVIIFVASIGPIASCMINQGFKQPNKPWAENAVIRGGRIRMLQLNYSTARPVFEKALTVFPRSAKRPNMYFWIGYCYEKEENYKKCKEWYNGFIQLYPTHPWIDQVKRREAEVETIQQ